MTDFSKLHPKIATKLEALGLSKPTKVQEKTIDLLLQKDIDTFVQAQTGSGKTLAFLLPILHKMLEGQHVRALILSPTRELAEQIYTVWKELLPKDLNKPIRSALLVGGASYAGQQKQLKRKVDVIVATPGRLKDHINRGNIEINDITHLVLDEADRMLDLGFQKDVIFFHELSKGSKETGFRNTNLFSATISQKVKKLALAITYQAKEITVDEIGDRHQDIEEVCIFADDYTHKLQLVKHILNDKSLYQAIVFTATKDAVKKLNYDLSKMGFEIAAIHGDMNQKERKSAIKQVDKNIAIALIGTDIAARGLDIKNVSHVINFDLPYAKEDYIHRIGRTGRAGKKGVAISLVGVGDKGKLRIIEKFLGKSIERVVIDGLEGKAGKRREFFQQKKEREKLKGSKKKQIFQEKKEREKLKGSKKKQKKVKQNNRVRKHSHKKK